MKRAFQAAIICATVAVPAFAQMDPVNCPMHKEHMATAVAPVRNTEAEEGSLYAGRIDLPIKALTSEALDAYRNGTGMGLAIPAEMNGYPGPRHVLDLAEQLQLTSEQRSRLQAIFDPMHAQAVRLGAEIIDLERKLDAGFSQSTMTEAQLTALTRDLADRQGRLRLDHLRAHLATKEVLTPAQVEAYNRLRGYSENAAIHAHHAHGE
jgi:Spy/CpxP family protein refolding chaperone